jgi:hypothetical protein
MGHQLVPGHRCAGLPYAPRQRHSSRCIQLRVHLAILAIGQQHALVAALIVANLGTLGAFIAVGLLAAGKRGNEPAAWRTLRVFIAYPLTFFLTAAYTEGTFFAFAIGTLFAARRGRWGWAALLAFLASLTRPTGAALLLPLLYEYGRQHEWWRREHWHPCQWLPLMRGVARIEAVTVIGAVPLAFGIYHPEARGPLPSGMEMNGPLPLGNHCAIRDTFARAMNPCLGAFGLVYLHNLSRVCGVPLGKPPAGKTGAVSWGLREASKYLGASAPRSSGGHPACSSHKREAPWL